MRKWFHVAFIPILLLSLVVLTACGGSKDAAGSSGGKSNELTVYTALEDDQLKAYLDSFKKSYPDIKVNLVRDSTGVITAKLLAEKDNPQADLVWGTSASSLLVADHLGMLEPYDPKGIERVSPEFRDSQSPAHWVGIDVYETAFVVNTVELQKRNLPVPQSYEDLIKPEYKGLIVMPNPSSSGTGFLTINAFFQLFGEQGAWDYMSKLHENIGLYTHSGSKPAKMAAAGEYPIGITFGYRGVTEKKKGAPLEVVFPKEGSGWDPEANALVKKKEIKPEAKVFLDWAISDDAMKEYNKNFAIITVSSVSEPYPEEYPKEPLKQLIKNDLNKAAKEREQWLAEWDKRFSTKSEPKS
ncbi:putative 2-aminoethylphosphonate ABC transporter substrate-binding protein [Brevibacillus sp. B_LB10_24]|uniref:putative 2-aminoethylphosphonate ABC transporter substrate-binding protein n=1 Tax=Brevibacillus sp. B_LB10_24 TaxID=3380645 RepID=UPI0038B886BC